MTGRHDVALLRLVAQRLAGEPATDAADAVRWLLAVQAQDLPGAVTSVALRTASRSRADVEAALAAGTVVRSWPMRGTLHLVAAEDLRWMLEHLAVATGTALARRRKELGLGPGDVEHAGELATRALTGGRRISRKELLAVWRDGGVATDGQRGYHLIANLAHSGLLCFGPLDGREPMLVLVDEWVAPVSPLEREGALQELARRYFRGHGPATVQDLARWSGVGLREARAATAAVAADLEPLRVDDVEHWMDPATPDRLAACRGHAREVWLLPGFDELLLGYADRSAVLAPEHAPRIVPGGNGVFRPTAVSDGRVVATWRATGTGSRRKLELEPFVDLPPTVRAAAEGAFAVLP